MCVSVAVISMVRVGLLSEQITTGEQQKKFRWNDVLYSAKQIKELKASKSDEPLGKLMLKLRTGCYAHMTGELTFLQDCTIMATYCRARTHADTATRADDNFGWGSRFVVIFHPQRRTGFGPCRDLCTLQIIKSNGTA